MGIDIAEITKDWNGHSTNKLMPFRQYLEEQFLPRPLEDARSVFQMFPDMLMHFGGTAIEKLPSDDVNFYGLVERDFKDLFEEGVKVPYYPDILFGDSLVKLGETIRSHRQQNVIYIFQGPPGSGKSTLLNNLLLKFEEYSNLPVGRRFEAYWQIPRKLGSEDENSKPNSGLDLVEARCPSHDHPLLIIPKQYRLEFLDQVGLARETKEQLFDDPEFDWLREREACTICTSLYQALLDILKSPDKVLEKLYVRRRIVSRRLRQGITVYNPGDKPGEEAEFTDDIVQGGLNQALKGELVKYVFSRYAPTNDGVYALMDIKSHNIERLLELHNIISEGVHNVGDKIEESVNSLFIALMNPEDRKESIEDLRSFQDRIEYITVPYARNIPTEIKMIVSACGEQTKEKFLPGVFKAFAAVIVSSHYKTKTKSKAIEQWLSPNIDRYKKVCDAQCVLLRIRLLQSGTDYFPIWMKDEDKDAFNKELRRTLVEEELPKEGRSGITGRDSLKIFQEFWSFCSEKNIIGIEDVLEFFRKKPKPLSDSVSIPDDILLAIEGNYGYELLQQVKGSLFHYNEEQISKDVKDYIFAVNYEIGTTTEPNPYTGNKIIVTEDYLKLMENHMLPPRVSEQQRLSLRKKTLNEYTSLALPYEIKIEEKDITETGVYRHLFDLYAKYVRENVLDAWAENESFRRAVKDYGTKDFESYDERVRRDVQFLLRNLHEKYGYTEAGAKMVCIYALDENLAKKFAGM